MLIYRCEIALMEATFFSTREVSDLYQTEPLLGNYALAYAFGFCASDYFNNGSIHYGAQLTPLNDRGLYITPGTFLGSPQFILRQFNAQTDAYWSAFGSGFIAARSKYGWSKKEGQHWYQVEPSGAETRLRATNRPQHGRMRMLAIGNRAVCYVMSSVSLVLPRYIRLGKFMSKARVESTLLKFEAITQTQRQVDMLLNPADLSPQATLSLFDLISVPPTPLVRNALIEGPFYHLEDGTWLPQGMVFNVEALT